MSGGGRAGLLVAASKAKHNGRVDCMHARAQKLARRNGETIGCSRVKVRRRARLAQETATGAFDGLGLLGT